MSDERGEARSDPGLEPHLDARPTGLPEVKSEARRRSRPLRPPRPGESERPAPAAEDAQASDARPTGLEHLTTSARLRLQLVVDQDEDERPRISAAPAPDPTVPPRLGQLALGPQELRMVRSLSRWIGFSGLMSSSIGALTGLSYFTGEGQIAHVVLGILATALSIWLIGAGLSLHRVARRKPRPRHHLINAFALLRSALLLKALLVFAAMVLGCFTFSLAVSLLFLL
jgi:hypothetical protein